MKNQNLSIEYLKSAIPLATVIGSIIELHNGKGLCPFHADRNPSLSIKGERFRCFACGEHGDVIDFIKKYHHLDTGGAIKMLATKAGIKSGTITPSERVAMQRERSKRERRAALVAVLDRWIREQRDTIAPLLRGTRQLLTRGISYKTAVTLGAKFFDDYAYIEHIHDEILAKDDRAAQLHLYKMEKGI